MESNIFKFKYDDLLFKVQGRRGIAPTIKAKDRGVPFPLEPGDFFIIFSVPSSSIFNPFSKSIPEEYIKFLSLESAS